jgi:hypothetical protein
VTLNAAAVEPSGTTAALPIDVWIVPVTCNIRASPVPSSAPTFPVDRESSRRNGLTGVYVEGDRPVVALAPTIVPAHKIPAKRTINSVHPYLFVGDFAPEEFDMLINLFIEPYQSEVENPLTPISMTNQYGRSFVCLRS